MDPTANLTELLVSLYNDDTDTARKRFDDLLEWIERGGFQPRWAEALTRVREYISATS